MYSVLYSFVTYLLTIPPSWNMLIELVPAKARIFSVRHSITLPSSGLCRFSALTVGVRRHDLGV